MTTYNDLDNNDYDDYQSRKTPAIHSRLQTRELLRKANFSFITVKPNYKRCLRSDRYPQLHNVPPLASQLAP